MSDCKYFIVNYILSINLMIQKKKRGMQNQMIEEALFYNSIKIQFIKFKVLFKLKYFKENK